MTDTPKLLAGKRGLILGLANERSIAWGIAQVLHEHGAELALTYQGAALEKRVRPLAEQLGVSIVLPFEDARSDEQTDALFTELKKHWDSFDFVVHSIAFSDKRELDGMYLNTSRAGFALALDVSCYSFTAIAQRAVPMMREGGSLLTLSYLGAERVMPHYNVMGVAKAALEASVRYLAADLGDKKIRVNAISAGPIKTLAASGIGDFNYILKWNELNAPMSRNVSQREVGGSALYLLSDLSSGVTGEVLHVDAGYHVVGMINEKNATQSGEMLTKFGAPKA